MPCRFEASGGELCTFPGWGGLLRSMIHMTVAMHTSAPPKMISRFMSTPGGPSGRGDRPKGLPRSPRGLM
jgi:hypothetical protein